MRIFDFVGFFCSRRSWHHGIWRPGRSKRGRQYSIGEAVGMHQPKTAGCSQPFAVRSGHTHMQRRTSSFHPFKSRAAEPAGWARHCAHSLHRAPLPCTQTALCLHAGMLLLSAPFSPPACLLSLVPSISCRTPSPPPSRAPTSRRIRNPRAVNQDTIRNHLPFFGCLLCGIL